MGKKESIEKNQATEEKFDPAEELKILEEELQKTKDEDRKRLLEKFMDKIHEKNLEESSRVYHKEMSEEEMTTNLIHMPETTQEHGVKKSGSMIIARGDKSDGKSIAQIFNEHGHTIQISYELWGKAETIQALNETIESALGIIEQEKSRVKQCEKALKELSKKE
jgi:hypothetical protein